MPGESNRSVVTAANHGSRDQLAMADDDAFSGSFDDYGSDFEEDQKAQRATRVSAASPSAVLQSQRREHCLRLRSRGPPPAPAKQLVARRPCRPWLCGARCARPAVRASAVQRSGRQQRAVCVAEPARVPHWRCEPRGGR